MSESLKQRLETLSAEAQASKNGIHPAATVRELLSWFDCYRRTWRNVQLIRQSLKNHNLTTFPDFVDEYIDGIVYFLPADSPLPGSSVASPTPETPVGTQGDSEGDREPTPPIALLRPVEPSHRIGRLAAANTPPTRVSPDAAISEALALMLINDFSQLPVMTSDREVKGLFSWKSYGMKSGLGGACTHVRDAMDGYYEINSDASMFDAIRIIAHHDCVLIRDNQKKISGIVTASDIGGQFRQLAEPFLILGDIENQVRYLLSTRFSVADLQSAKDPNDTHRVISDASDLSFGEYVRFLQKDENWQKFGIKIDKKAFLDEFGKLREIRNDVMHFDPDPIAPSDMDRLNRFSALLVHLSKLAISVT